MTQNAPSTQRPQVEKSSQEKESDLRRLMREMGSVLVAYSGGVDSSYLAHVATQELGKSAVCVMGISPSVSTFQRSEGASLAQTFGFNFETVDTSELEDPQYIENTSSRCYFCKSELFAKLQTIASDRNVKYVADGTNADDIDGHRPGRAAAIEQGVRSPLVETSFSKNEIRERSRLLGLPTWDRPASPCLSSRIASGVPVTIERLGKVERGESFLRAEGLREFRVRVHGDLVRLEISPDELDLVLSKGTFARFSKTFKELGFRFVTLDLTGYRSGSLSDQFNTSNNLEN